MLRSTKAQHSMREAAIEEEKHEDLLPEALQMIDDGMMDKLKVDHCKAYLKNYKIRVSGRKQELLERIEQHLMLQRGRQEAFARNTFQVDCTGDACVGDVVLFQQKVYDNFDVASRCSSTPCLGTRTIAGRIVKESYGAEKQQHTFTIDVLWSVGVQPLGPLQQLLIKGRNLYRLKTFRQKWLDENERSKLLEEKHQRGRDARLKRSKALKGKANPSSAQGEAGKCSSMKENQPPNRARKCAVIEMRNVVYSATVGDIREFFKGYRISEDGIDILVNAQNRPLGTVTVKFNSANEAARAFAKHGQFLGSRQVFLRQPKFSK